MFDPAAYLGPITPDEHRLIADAYREAVLRRAAAGRDLLVAYAVAQTCYCLRLEGVMVGEPCPRCRALAAGVV